MNVRLPNPASSTIYFGYGSNLWLFQMAQRCPTSTYRGVARLNNYKWIINSRGYANVVECDSSSSILPNDIGSDRKPSEDKSYVYGLVYDLLPTDESRLDKNEGVPVAYTKEFLKVDFWEGRLDKNNGWVDVGKDPVEKSMLVYIDRKKVADDKPKKEYIHRMNEGISDALKVGVPKEYLKLVLRKYIPEESDADVREFANKQALSFQDENKT